MEKKFRQNYCTPCPKAHSSNFIKAYTFSKFFRCWQDR